jgi:hypothetical protein
MTVAALYIVGSALLLGLIKRCWPADRDDRDDRDVKRTHQE